jgi:rubrerythrin
MVGKQFGWLRYGMQLEAKSIEFYSRCLEAADSSYLRSLFSFLRDEERAHSEILAKILNESSQSNSENIAESIEFLKSLGPPPLFTDADLEEMKSIDTSLAGRLNKAIELENKGITLYTKAMDEEKDPGVKRLLAVLVDKEIQHKHVILAAGAKLI